MNHSVCVLIVALALAHLIVAIGPDSVVPEEYTIEDDTETITMLQNSVLPSDKTKVTNTPTGEPRDEESRDPTDPGADTNSPMAPTNKLSIPILKESEVTL